MPQPPSPRITGETIRQLAATVDIRPDEASLEELAKTFGVMLAAVERCEELNLAEHEPCTTLTLTGGAPDAEL